MSSNLDRFQKDLEKLIERGRLLHSAMMMILRKEDFIKAIKTTWGAKTDDYVKALPDFYHSYESWYSEALAVIKQVLPDRSANFVSFYEKPKGRKALDSGNYVLQDFLQGLSTKNGLGETIVGPSAAYSQFTQQVAILDAAKARFESSLFEIKQLVQADIFDSEIDAARELLKNGFLRAAGAVAGVVLEKHLLQVCENHKLPISKKHPTISDLNNTLKEKSVIDLAQWRYVSYLGDIRNLCDHNKTVEPNGNQLQDLIDGVNKAIKTIV